MKAIKHKTSILLAGFLNGLNFFCFTPHNNISKILGSTKNHFKVSDNEGFHADAQRLSGDWIKVREDLMSSFNSAENGIKQG